MCGIAGFYDAEKKTEEKDLRKITDILSHRGPDDRGYLFESNENFNLGLGHRRLSILDLSPLGHQPMRYENLSIIYNGEVYNFKSIRDILKNDGYEFASNSDTEVILKAFHKWDMEAIHYFNGMFAIALYNHSTYELFLIRDRIGVKPLYYYTKENTVVFSSELKSIINYPHFRKEIDFDSLNSFLFHGYITAPKSIFKNVQKLEPGTFLRISSEGQKVTSYWNLKDKFLKREIKDSQNEREILTEFDSLVNSAVKYRMVSDAPIGAFLSGGYDSSLVTAIMQKNASMPINTFTIGFNEKEFDEAQHAKEIAECLGTNHHEIYLPISKAKDLIEKLPQFFDEPFGDSSQLPMMLLSEFTRKEVTVALSGDGGDELFCGYSSYDVDLVYQKYMGLSNILKLVDNVLNLKSLVNPINSRWDKFFLIDKFSSITNLEYLRAQPYVEGLVDKKKFLLNSKYFETADLSNNIQEGHMLQDMLTYLPDDIMVKVDRATMSASLEGREPLLDYRLFEFSFNLPHHYKYRGKEKKYLLKQLAYNYIPKKLLDRPKKGFSVPLNKWLKSDLSFLSEQYLNDDYLISQSIFNVKKVKTLLRIFKQEEKNGMATKVLWNILVFQLWYETYMR